MGNRLHSPPDHPEHEKPRLAITVFLLAMIPLLIVGAFVVGASYGVVGPLAGLLGILAAPVVWYYFR